MTRAFDHEPTPAERGDYWVAVHTWVLDSSLTTKAKITYVVLMSYADRAGHAWPSLRALSGRTGLSRASVCRALTELEDAGIIRRTAQYRGGERTSTRYVVRAQSPVPLSRAVEVEDGMGGTVWTVPPDQEAPPPSHGETRLSQGGVQEPHGDLTPSHRQTTCTHSETTCTHSETVNTTNEHTQRTHPGEQDDSPSVGGSVLVAQRAEARPTATQTTIDVGSDTEEPPADSRALEPMDPRPSPEPAPPARPSRARARRATRLPEDFAVTPAMAAWAAQHAPGVDHEAETARFRDYWAGVPGQRGTKLDWEATWRNWMRRANEDAARYGRYQPPQGRPSLPTDDETWDRVTQQLFTPTAYRDVIGSRT